MRTSNAAFVAALTLGVALLGAAPSGPAAAFLETWDKISSYTTNIKVHETKGSDVQDRTYHYAYLKPHFAKIDITGGAGRGGGAVWKGGDSVTGHKGFASFIKMSRPLNSSDATDLRGGNMVQASFQDMAEELKDATSQTSEASYNASSVDVVSFPYSDPNGATKREIYISRQNHLPVRRVTYAGNVVVEDEMFSEINVNAGLKESDF